MYLSLFGLPLPSTIFPLTSGLTCRENIKDGEERRRGRDDLDANQSQDELLCCECLVVRLVGISFFLAL